MELFFLPVNEGFVFLLNFKMARNPQKLLQRNQALLARIKVVKNKNPKWRWECVLDEVAKEFFLEVSTVRKIVSNPTYIGDTVALSATSQVAINFPIA